MPSLCATIEIIPSRCLNVLNAKVDCTHCVDLCPSDSITAKRHGIVIDTDSCLGCGLCLHECPTGVFGSEYWDEVTFMADAHLLACHHAADCDPETQVLPGCLALISPVGFYSAALNDSVSLDMSGCLDCDAYAALERMDYSIDTAIEWLQAGGLQADFCLVFDESADSDNPPQSRQAPDIAVTSRRDLFVSLLEKARQLLTESKTQAQPITKPDYGNLLPAWRQHLRDIYVTTGKAEDRVAWWPYIERTTDCVGCGMCARFCPTGTLKTVIEDGASVSYFTPGDCLDCRICQLFCPKQAIIRSREQVVNPFSPIEVFRSDAGNCTRCGTPVIGWQIDLCYWCEASVKADREIANSLRGMFKKSH